MDYSKEQNKLTDIRLNGQRLENHCVKNAQRAKERNDRKMMYEGNENTSKDNYTKGAKRNSRALK